MSQQKTLKDLFANLFRSQTYMIESSELDELLCELNQHEKRQKSIGYMVFELQHLVLALHRVAFRKEYRGSGIKTVTQNEVLASWLMSEPFIAITAELQGSHGVDPAMVERCRSVFAFMLGYRGPGFAVEAMLLNRQGWSDGIWQRSLDFPGLNPSALLEQAGVKPFQRSNSVR